MLSLGVFVTIHISKNVPNDEIAFSSYIFLKI